MMCKKCNKRPAIIFVQRMDAGDEKSEGYCLTCAHEMGIKPVEDLIQQFGISDDDLEAMEERFAGFMSDGDFSAFQMPQDSADAAEAEEQEEEQGWEEEVPAAEMDVDEGE